MKKDHNYFMKLAMKLALKARGRTSPNPMVGALVVRNSKVVGQGYHAKAGLAHAEVIALDAAGKKSKGATLYVTLEPCVHFGKTPPCVDRIIKSGIREVIVGMIDPNPMNNGRGISILRQHRIRVKAGYLEDELKKMNEVFIKYISKKMPFVTVKVAQSLDGKIATKTGDSKWITSDKSRAFAHRLRQDYDAIIVGVNTVLRDNPRLNAWFSKRHPAKVIVDSQLSIHENANIFSGKGEAIIVTLSSSPGQETENRQTLGKKAKILEVKGKTGQINLKSMMKKLAQLEIANILVEGGGTLIGSLFDEGLVDKVLFFVSPKIIGGKEAISSVMGQGIDRIERSFKLKDVRLKKMGGDFLFEGYVYGDR
ncbi:MAG: bifunctional diaminohydroxyphosphoribosylaminopyrimidine deaminase/5-amino-6-(5-phosphoribosylamino)uracil reductase RibD [Candidatus Omnitrophica bacterium]|nr:bifunctional diaminohydroxyphosphoribosylaminopyrimidine deaminase/5-amino-6-(5-phosphoribosylamino)uracil reductase RibD [Candidatus Omnitrophota bacterium]MDD5237799.1 bifunctional diaminohydroxyphosphoribosylaminopyrimidine deaminase/5-amino-6-(5-phosphoribosylamino)uracil reductase RibD [Candidatus Omnitrophota bacterium]